jgi:hypothetical protein
MRERRHSRKQAKPLFLHRVPGRVRSRPRRAPALWPPGRGQTRSFLGAGHQVPGAPYFREFAALDRAPRARHVGLGACIRAREFSELIFQGSHRLWRWTPLGSAVPACDWEVVWQMNWGALRQRVRRRQSARHLSWIVGGSCPGGSGADPPPRLRRAVAPRARNQPSPRLDCRTRQPQHPAGAGPPSHQPRCLRSALRAGPQPRLGPLGGPSSSHRLLPVVVDCTGRSASAVSRRKPTRRR